MKKNSLKFIIPFYIMVFAICCVFITGFLLQFIISDNLEKKAMEKNMIISKMIGDQIHLYLEDAKSTVVTASNFSSQSNGDLERIKEEIFRMYDNFDYFSLIFFTNSQAEMVFSKPSNEHVKERRYYDRSYFWDIMNGKSSTISPLLISSVLKKPHFIIAAPVYNYSQERIGLIGAGLPLSNIKKVIEKTQKNFDGNIWLADANGNMAVHPDINIETELVELANREVNIHDIKIDFNQILKEKKDVICNYTMEDKKYYGAVTFISGADWMVVVEQSESAIFSEVFQLKGKLKDVIILGAIIALIFGLIIALKITNPIESLVKQVRKVGEGIKDMPPIEVNLKSKDEIWELSKAFKDMSIKLQENISELEESFIRENKLQQYLNNILRSVKSGIIVIDKESRITVFNKEAESLTGFKSEEFLNKKIDELWVKTSAKLEYMSESVLNEGKTYSGVEVVIKDKKGKEVSTSVFASQVLDDDKKGIGVVFLLRDITEIKIMEEELKKEDRIRTLGELSASIIHDIGNPLAGISNLVEVLKDQSCDQATKEEVLSVLQKEVEDLNRLVIDFLDFSHDSNLGKESENILFLIDNIINLLKPEIIDKKINIKRDYDNDPIVVEINRRDIKQAFINIIKNAIHAVDENGEIEVSIKSDDNDAQIYIKDNGVGIDEDKLERIFYPFYTTKDEGTGLGLSIAYKQIKKYGGQVRVKSQRDRGTEFLITLPIKK